MHVHVASYAPAAARASTKTTVTDDEDPDTEDANQAEDADEEVAPNTEDGGPRATRRAPRPNQHFVGPEWAK